MSAERYSPAAGAKIKKQMQEMTQFMIIIKLKGPILSVLVFCFDLLNGLDVETIRYLKSPIISSKRLTTSFSAVSLSQIQIGRSTQNSLTLILHLHTGGVGWIVPPPGNATKYGTTIHKVRITGTCKIKSFKR